MVGRSGSGVTVTDARGSTVTGSAVAEALARAAAAGGFFAVEPGPVERLTPGQAPWRPWTDLTDLADGPGVIGVRIGATQTALAARVGGDPSGIEARVAASLVQLGLAARLVSVGLGAAVLAGIVPDLGGAGTDGAMLTGSPVERGGLWWQDVLGGPVPLALPRPRGRQFDSDDLDALAEEFVAAILDGPVAGLNRAVAAHTSVSAKILHGNVASALGGAVKMLGAAVPARASAARDLVARLLARDPLTGTGGFDYRAPDRLGSPRAGWTFTRTTCCLFYRVPGGGLCGDCVLAKR